MNADQLFLNKQQVEFIHEKSLELLSTAGVKFEHQEAVEKFKQHGVKVEGEIVYLDEKTVMDALKNVPETFELNGRTGSTTIGERNTIFGPAAGPPYILDNNVVRRANLEDYIKLLKVTENSDVLGFTHLLVSDVADVPAYEKPYIMMATLLKYSTKPINITSIQTSKESVLQVARKQVGMVKEFYDCHDKNVVIGGVCAISPLSYGKDDVDGIYAMAEENQPIMMMACSLPSLTSPASVLGTIIQNNAEVLAGITLAQILSPGLPIIYANTSTSTNLREITLSLGSAETALMSYATAALAKFYKMPFRTSGCLSDAVANDYQAGVESSLNVTAGIFSGVDVMQFACGILGSFNIVSLEKYMLDEQTVKMHQRVHRGIDIDFNKSYIDEIIKVGPRGNFLKGRTPKEYRQEHFIPNIFNKADYNAWKEKDGKTVVEKAAIELDKRLNEYSEPELTAAQQKVLSQFI